MHRVQRVPVTESQGRIHTSAAGVLVLPEAEEVDVDDRPERPAHRRLPVVRARRAERQHDRLGGADHAPADRHRRSSLQNEKSQLQNREAGDARSCAPGCWPPPQEEADAEDSDARGAQVRTVDRSEQVRTYNFPENRVADHRSGYKANNLDQVLDGDLDAVIQSLRRRRPRRPARRRMTPRSSTSMTGRLRECRRRAAADAARRPPGVDSPGARRRGRSPSTSLGLAEPSDLLMVDDARRRPGRRRTTTLVARRAARVPLQHLTGSVGFRYIELEVGPGVFVPRPETESVVAVGRRRAGRERGAGRAAASSTCAPAPARSRSRSPTRSPGATVHAVERDARRAGLDPPQRNPRRGRRSRGHLHLGDAPRTRCPSSTARVDLVVEQPAVRRHDEAHIPDPEVARPRPRHRAVGAARTAST